tara:strand:+ start:1945 stop:2334 length:390 start_codon:yes stop_codon:yes gene_type:complete
MNKFFLYEDFFKKGEKYYQDKKYYLALYMLNQAISLDLPLTNQKKAEAYELIGSIKIQMNRHLDSISDFNKAISLDPKNASLFFYRGNALCVLDDKEGALKDFNQLIKFEPNNKSAKEMSKYLKELLGD